MRPAEDSITWDLSEHLAVERQTESGTRRDDLSALNYFAVMVLLALAVPLPFELMARIRTLYIAPLTSEPVVSERLVITKGVVVSAGLNAFHVVPLLVEYS